MLNDSSHVAHSDGPLPAFDITVLDAYVPPLGAYTPDTNTTTISVEVLAIVGASATTLAGASASIFYDSETLAVVHRFKAKASGLASTTVWAWRGRHATPGEHELSKAQKLARRYGTTLVSGTNRAFLLAINAIGHRAHIACVIPKF